MKIVKGPTIKCKRCFFEFEIAPSVFKSPKTVSDERSMGYEIQYTWEHVSKCVKCGNEMRLLIEGYEYPEGVLNHEEFVPTGCILVENPKFEIEDLDEENEED